MLLYRCAIDQIVAEIRLLREQARLIVAGELLARVDQFLAKGGQQERKVREARALLGGELKDDFDQVRQRAAECRGALEDWHSVSDLLTPGGRQLFCARAIQVFALF